VQQAGARAVGEEAVGARSQQEHLLHGVERAVDRAGAGERAVENALALPRAAMLRDARVGVVLAQEDERKALVIAQQHVEAGAEALDQLRLQQQGFGLGVGGNDRHRPGERHHALQAARQARDLRVVGDAALQTLRLADVQRLAGGIEHPVDARPRRQGLQHVADRRDALIEIGLVASANRIGRLLFGKPVVERGFAHPVYN
jgi:hypothetical protein